MAYSVYISDRDQAYLNGLPLSTTARGRLGDFVEYAIANVVDSFRNDPANRLQPNSPIFQVEFVLLNAGGDDRFHKIRFLVSDEHAANGVLAIVFVDHQQIG